MYSIVDIETTGGHATGNRIIEIAILKFDGEKVTDRFETLVHPGERIPGYITALTGITDEMVACAPSFEAIAETIERFTADTIFVAHNANFDYSFLKKEFALLGASFERKRLCTVRLSRKIIPGYASYSLGSLCGQLGIKIRERHRAAGDAEATTELLKLLLEHDKENFIGKSLNIRSRETHLPREQFDVLPEEAGVYYFHDRKGRILYVGKATNIKQRVTGHFSAKQQSRQSQHFMREIHGISFELCGNELIALLLESYEIKKHWPPYNRAQKKAGKNYGIYLYEDLLGYSRISIGNVQKHQKPLLYFRYVSEAREFLEEKCKEYDLCAKLCGLQKPKKGCAGYYSGSCSGACVGEEAVEGYNAKLLKALSSLEEYGKTYALTGRGRNEEEYSVVLVEDGKYLGYGFVPADTRIQRFGELKEFVNGHWDNQDVQKILNSYLRNAEEGTIRYWEPEQHAERAMRYA